MTDTSDRKITPESVDDMTDEQVSALLQAEEAPAVEETPKESEKAAIDPEKKEPDSDPEDFDDDGPADKAEKVDFKRFDYERRRRKKVAEEKAAIEQQAARDRAEWARRFDELLKHQAPPAQKQEEKVEETPTWDDPIARMQWLEQRVEQLQGGISQRTEQEQQLRAHAELVNQHQDFVRQHFAAAVQSDPQVQKAYEAAASSYDKELEFYGYRGQQLQQARQEVYQNFLFAASQAIQNGTPMADYIKGIASTRGWRPEAPVPAPDPTPTIDTAEAQRRARTLSNGGGSPGVSDSLSAEAILNMSDKDFDAIVAKYGSVAAALAAQ